MDECIDWRLARELTGHDVKTAREMGWNAIKNGELLALAGTRFDVFLTVDRNLIFQQNLGGVAIAIVVLGAKTNRLADLRELVPRLLETLPSCGPGTIHQIDESK